MSQPVPTPGSAPTSTTDGGCPPPSTQREQRVVDQTLSMHAALSDRARVIAVTVRVVLLCLSIVGVAFAFAGPDGPVTLLGLTAARSTWLGWLSVLVFAGTLTDLVTDRRTTARQHADAVNALARLKLAYRAAASTPDWAATASRLTEQYNAVMDALPAVPERQFNRLKAAHLQKVEISKLLSRHPGLSQRAARRHVRQAAQTTMVNQSPVAGSGSPPSAP